MNLRRRASALVLAPALALCPALGAAQLLDVSAVLSLAESRSRKVAIAESLLQASGERLEQTRSLRYPSIEFSANASQQREAEKVGVVDNRIELTGSRGTLSFSQPIFRPVTSVQLELDSVLVRRRTLEVGQAKADARFAAFQAVIAYLSAAESLTLFEAQQASLAHLVKQAARNYEMGLVTITDSQEAQAKFDALVAQRVAAERDVGVAWLAIQTMIGPGPLGRGVDRATLPSEARPVQALPEIMAAARERNLRLKLAELSVLSAELDIKRYKAVEMPTVDLIGSVARAKEDSAGRFGSIESFTTTKQIGVQLTYPLFSGLSGVHKDRELQHLYERAVAEKDDATLAVEEEVLSAHMRAQSTEEQARLLELARTSQMSAEASIERGLSVGVRLWIDLLNARQQRFTIERDLARVRYDRELAQARLRLLADSPIH